MNTNALVWLGVLCLCVSPALGDTVAHWEFEEGPLGAVATGAGRILDSANGRDGTPLGVLTYVSTGRGTMGLDFGGPDDLVFVPDHYTFAITGSLTLEAILILQGIPSSNKDDRQIVWYGDGRQSLDPYFLGIQRSDGRLVFQVEGTGDRESRIVSPDALPEGPLIHVAGTLDDTTGEQKLYINRVEVASTTTSIRPFGALDPSRNPGIGIGNIQDSSSQFFEGIIADVRISDVALDPDDCVSDPLTPMGDVDLSGYVDDDDLSILLANWNEYADWGTGDLDWNGFVADNDLSLLLANWNAGTPPMDGGAVPEPATLALLAVGGLALIRRRR